MKNLDHQKLTISPPADTDAGGWLAQSDQALARCAQDGPILQANRVFAELFERTEQECVGRNLTEFAQVRSLDELAQGLIQNPNPQGARRVAWRRLSKNSDSTQVWLALNAEALVPDLDHLSQLRQRLAAAQTGTSDWVWEQDANFRFTYLRAFEGETDAYLRQLVGRTRWDALSGTRVEGGWEAHQATLEAHRPFEVFVHCEVEGKRRVFQSVGVPTFDANQVFTGYRGFGRDITPYRDVIESLGSLEHRLLGLVDAMPNGFIAHTNGKIEYANHVAAKLLGVADPGSMVGSHILDWIAPTHRAGASERLSRAYAAPTVLPTVEQVWLREDNRPANLLVSSVSVSLNGKIVAQTILQDLAEKLRLESERAKIEQTISLIAEASDEFFWELDNEERFVHVSARAREVIGHEVSALLGNHPRDFMPPGEIERVNAVLAARPPGEMGFRKLEHRVLRSDGTIRWIEVTSIPVLTSEGTVARSVGTSRDITERKLSEEKVWRLAHLDSLTGLPNRPALLGRIRSLIDGARDRAFAVCYIDLDGFKAVNDMFGHDQGDRLLQTVARSLNAEFPEPSFVARLGGDEFVVLCQGSGTTRAAAAQCAQRVIELTEELSRATPTPLPLSASVGIAFYPEDASKAETLLHLADSAMYEAKRGSGGHWLFHTPELGDRTRRRMSLRAELTSALEHGELRVHYQPVIDLGSRHPVHAEALVRWQRGDSLDPPATFLPLAEESRLMARLGGQVLELVGQQMTTWRDQGLAPPRIAVNLSAQQLARANRFVDEVDGVLQRYALRGDQLLFELTETSYVNDLAQLMPTLRAFQQRGIELAIDDFGTGYSSLARLHQLPVSYLKLDRSFVGNALKDRRAQKIVENVFDLSRRLGVKVIAEGAEDEATLNWLEALGFSLVQGFVFSRPIAGDAYAAAYLKKT